MGKFTDLELDVEVAFRLKLLRPDLGPLLDKDGKQAYIDIMSLDSQKAEQLAKETRERRRAAGAVTQDSIEADGVDSLARLTTGWYLVGGGGKPVVDAENNPVPYTVENARELYASRGARFITDQVRGAAAERSNFMPASWRS